MKPKRHRGQNFLIDGNIVRKIIAAARLTKDSVVLEVGPGKGALTEELVKGVGRVIAVEIDKDLFASLEKKFVDTPNLTLIKDDILDVDVASLLQRVIGDRLSVIGYLIVANIPYNITSRFLRKFLEVGPRPKKLVVMVQKEVAERMTATAPDMSLLALSVQLFSTPRILFPVSPNCFFPKPRVQSVVMELRIKADRELPSVATRETLFRLAKAAFSEKRKQCAKLISKKCDLEPERVLAAFEKVDLDPRARAESISVQQWLELVHMLSPSP